MKAIHPSSQADELQSAGDCRQANDVIDNIPHRRTTSHETEEESYVIGETIADEKEVLRCLSPFLTCMKLFGLYYSRQEAVSRDEKHQNSCSKTDWQRVYCIVVVVLLWLNAVRFFSVFNSDDTFGARLLLKVVWFISALLYILLHTSYFSAYESGKMDQVFKELRLVSDLLPYFRRVVVFYAVVACVFMTASVVTQVYALFFTDGLFDFILAPFVTHIPVENNVIRHVVKAIVLVCFFHTNVAGASLEMMNHTLAFIIHRQFAHVKNRFHRSIDERGRFDGDLRSIRRFHNRLGETVELADDFVMMGNVCFIFRIVSVALVAYVLLLCDFVERPYVSWLLISNVLSVVWTAVDAALVNFEVHYLPPAARI
jgi:hypothetical protein